MEILKVSYSSGISDEALRDMPNLKELECRGVTNIKDRGLCNLIEMSQNLQLLDVSGCKNITNELINVAIKATKIRTNNQVLKIFAGGTSVNFDQIKDLSPLSQILNVNNSKPSIKHSFDADFDYFADHPYFLDDLLDDDSTLGLDEEDDYDFYEDTDTDDSDIDDPDPFWL